MANTSIDTKGCSQEIGGVWIGICTQCRRWILAIGTSEQVILIMSHATVAILYVGRGAIFHGDASRDTRTTVQAHIVSTRFVIDDDVNVLSLILGKFAREASPSRRTVATLFKADSGIATLLTSATVDTESSSFKGQALGGVCTK